MNQFDTLNISDERKIESNNPQTYFDLNNNQLENNHNNKTHFTNVNAITNGYKINCFFFRNS